jgi:hypothetical protein
MAAIATIIDGHLVTLSLIGVAILTLVYGLRAFSWGRKI